MDDLVNLNFYSRVQLYDKTAMCVDDTDEENSSNSSQSFSSIFILLSVRTLIMTLTLISRQLDNKFLI